VAAVAHSLLMDYKYTCFVHDKRPAFYLFSGKVARDVSASIANVPKCRQNGADLLSEAEPAPCQALLDSGDQAVCQVPRFGQA
jgi:hypothetical protein